MSAVGSLAARLGMRRSPSGLDATGALTQPPAPPVMRFDYLRRVVGTVPDPVVFGPQYEPFGIQLPVRHCLRCDVGWSIYGGPECWNCGRPCEPT